MFWLVAWATGKISDRKEPSDDALEIARKRLARGEISEEEFLRLKQHLT
ncbi:MAG TPA: SHOCT domain-containing protein [Dehalococcoidia bacterium]|nr:SHOCT domain-containing protein [Dehalococcoidia bacterium]